MFTIIAVSLYATTGLILFGVTIFAMHPLHPHTVIQKKHVLWSLLLFFAITVLFTLFWYALVV